MINSRIPAEGLLPQACAVCGEEFQPYRAGQITCSRKRTGRRCYDRLPRRRERNQQHAAAYRARPEYGPAKRAYDKARYDREQSYRASLKSRYGITLEQYDRMVAEQGGKCAICGAVPSGTGSAGRLHVDHDHDTGKVRGLLCLRCNHGVGYFADSPDRLMAATAYLMQYEDVLQPKE